MTYDPAEWNVNGNVHEIYKYATTFIRNQTLAFLNYAGSLHKPWFAYVTPMAPHLPAKPDTPYRTLPVGPFPVNPAMTEQDRTDKPPYVQSDTPLPLSDWAAIRQEQLRSLASVNDLVNALVNRLHTLGELHNTMIIYSTDNGFMWGEHGLHIGGKSVPYLPSVRVPLFIRWPGHVQARTVDNRIVALLDLAPTILDATGTPLPHTMDGIDLLRPGPSRSGLLLEFWTWGTFRVPTWAGLVTPTYEYVEYYDDQNNVTFREFYDLKGDIFQLTNLLGDSDTQNDPDVGSLSSQLTALRTCVGWSCFF